MLSSVGASTTQPAHAQATFRGSKVSQDGAVVTRGIPIPVWGWAAPSMSEHLAYHDPAMRQVVERGQFEVVGGRSVQVMKVRLDVTLAAGRR
ncbi:MAG: hypothetical protein H7066_13865 [Cytophagaceae bacterium]|nr:hypothetical protein [Gemmatimonadaceae bacterium]